MDEKLKRIYQKTDGYCHLCYRKLALKNYGKPGYKGAWHIEHSIPKAKGGANHLNNLYAACVECNIEKGTLHTKTIRKRNGLTRAPLSKEKKLKVKSRNSGIGASIGLIIGNAIAGPIGAGIFSFIGSELGKSVSPKK